MRRVVVTGMGAITPIGLSVDEFWNSVKENTVGNLFNSMPVRSPDGSTVSIFQLYIIKRNSQGLNGKTSKLSHIIIVNLSAIYPLIEV